MSSTVFAKRTYGAYLCKNNAKYDCYKVKRRDTWKKLFPNKKKRDLVKRINRKNIRLRRGTIIAVPAKLVTLDYYEMSPFHLWVRPAGKKVIIFDPKKLAWAAYDKEGKLVKWGPASGGNTWCADVRRGCRTIRGEFSMYHKRGAYCRSGKYPLRRGGAPMPYCMFFYKGFAFHGSPTVPGYNASHGCIRIFKEDAAWLNRHFVTVRKNEERVNVIVLPYGKMTHTR